MMRIDADGPMRVIHIWLSDWVIQFWWGRCGWHVVPYMFHDPDDGCALFWRWSMPGLEIRAWREGWEL